MLFCDYFCCVYSTPLLHTCFDDLIITLVTFMSYSISVRMPILSLCVCVFIQGYRVIFRWKLVTELWSSDCSLLASWKWLLSRSSWSGSSKSWNLPFMVLPFRIFTPCCITELEFTCVYICLCLGLFFSMAIGVGLSDSQINWG